MDHVTTVQILPSMVHFFDQGSREEDLYFHMSSETHNYRKYNMHAIIIDKHVLLYTHLGIVMKLNQGTVHMEHI